LAVLAALLVAPFARSAELTIAGPAGSGELPLDLSTDWSHPLPAVTRAVIVVHGAQRDAAAYLRYVEQAYTATAEPAAATLLIAPHFPTTGDVTEHSLPAGTLRWAEAGWQDGSPAIGPVSLSSFAALDAILLQLADRSRFPALRRVVLAGHSAGGQLVQRYAVAGRGDAALAAQGIKLRYLVANPSSYVWFGDARPQPVDRAACPSFDHWKYGLTEPPPYVGATDALEERYIARDVVYLLGQQDTDPDHQRLDRSCAAEAQGANRYARGMQYLFSLELRHPNLVRHRLFSIPGVGHDASGMFGSVCGRAALFDQPGCSGF
jgi:pimeloyl-ACP methyl ester carboxylesterase